MCLAACNLCLVSESICKLRVSLCYSLRTEAPAAVLQGSALSDSNTHRMLRWTHNTHMHHAQDLCHYLSVVMFPCLRAGVCRKDVCEELDAKWGRRSGLSCNQKSIFCSLSWGEGNKEMLAESFAIIITKSFIYPGKVLIYCMCLLFYTRSWCQNQILNVLIVDIQLPPLVLFSAFAGLKSASLCVEAHFSLL